MFRAAVSHRDLRYFQPSDGGRSGSASPPASPKRQTVAARTMETLNRRNLMSTSSISAASATAAASSAGLTPTNVQFRGHGHKHGKPLESVTDPQQQRRESDPLGQHAEPFQHIAEFTGAGDRHPKPAARSDLGTTCTVGAALAVGTFRHGHIGPGQWIQDQHQSVIDLIYAKSLRRIESCSGATMPIFTRRPGDPSRMI